MQNHCEGWIGQAVSCMARPIVLAERVFGSAGRLVPPGSFHLSRS